MSILKTILSIGAGIITAAASYVLMSSKNESSTVDNQSIGVDNGGTQPSKTPNKSENLLRRLDKIQVGLVNFARFASEVIRSISLFVRAMKCYEYDTSYQQYQQYQR